MSELKADAVSPVLEVLSGYDQTLSYEENLTKIESFPVSDHKLQG